MRKIAVKIVYYKKDLKMCNKGLFEGYLGVK